VTDKCCPRCGKVHSPLTDDDREAQAMARALAGMLMEAAREACRMMKQRRPDFVFLPIILMNVVHDGDDRLMATTCEVPAGNDKEDIATLLRMAAEHIDAMPEGMTQFMASEVSDDPTKH